MNIWPEIHHGGKRVPCAAAAGKKEEEMIDFSVNVTPLGIPENIRSAMEESLNRAGWYPDYSKERLKRALGAFHHLEPSHICMGNGAADVIYRTVFALKPKKALVLAPTFAEYAAALRCVDARIDSYRIDHADFQVKMDICEQIEADTEMVFLCNPNNPTGLLISKDIIEKVLKRCEAVGAWLVVDECFLEFIADGKKYSVIEDLLHHERLMIIKSFTKMFGIAGLRLGYLLCGKAGLAERIDRFGCDWNVNCVAEAAGLEALKSQDYIKKVIRYITKEREWLCRELTAMGFLTVHGAANYLLFKVPDGSRENLGKWLLKRGIMLRCCDDYENLDGTFYRIGMNRHEENRKLLEALKEWIK